MDDFFHKSFQCSGRGTAKKAQDLSEKNGFSAAHLSVCMPARVGTTRWICCGVSKVLCISGRAKVAGIFSSGETGEGEAEVRTHSNIRGT